MKFNSLPNEIDALNKDAVFKKRKRERWHESLAKDIYVEEALNVFDDLQLKAVTTKAMPVKIKKGKLAKS